MCKTLPVLFVMGNSLAILPRIRAIKYHPNDGCGATSADQFLVHLASHGPELESGGELASGLVALMRRRRLTQTMSRIAGAEITSESIVTTARRWSSLPR